MNSAAELAATDPSERLLQLVRVLVQELHPSAGTGERVSLDSVLDRDLGLDSLARVELFLRVEREFKVRLPEGLLGTAETPLDLLRAVGGSPQSAASLRRRIAQPIGDGEFIAAPDHVGTLVEALEWHRANNADRIHIRLLGENDRVEPISYGALFTSAHRVAAGLQARGFKAGDTAALMLPTGREFFFAYFGVLFAGGVPVPIYPPARLSQIEDHLLRQKGILANAGALTLITVQQAKAVGRLLQGQVESLKSIVTPAELALSATPAAIPAIRSEDLAFIQYTSGSTGNPKGVMLTHANLLANICAMRDALQVTPSDVFVSWLPLYHDMGLIGAWLGSLYCGYPLVIMSPLAFLSRPVRWLKAIHEYRGTLSAGPNFAYELCLSKIDDQDLEGLDLSSWRLALNGAEPVSPQTMERFVERFSRYRFRREAMLPVYGLAESALGVSFPPLGRGPLIDVIQRAPFVSAGRAIPAAADDHDALRCVACGGPLPGHAIRVVDDAGHEVPERVEGHLQFKGPSTTRGYYRNPEETARMKRGDWLDSFDLAYRVGSDIYITGRAKDIIIRAGRNLYPYELEAAVGSLPGIRRGCVAVFGSRDRQAATERLVVVAETREQDANARDQLTAQINALAVDLVGTPADHIVLAPPHSVLKTSSGKIRRAATRERYEQGLLGQEQRAVWQQFARLGISGVGGGALRLLHTAVEVLYGVYAVAAFMLCALIASIGVLLLPSPQRPRAFARFMARAALRLMGLAPRVEGIERVPIGQPYIAITNHASYLDGVVLFATLPGTPSFVVKGELGQHRALGPFLRKIGMRFVERFAAERSIEDAALVAQDTQQGRAFVFFPEGTLRRTPGLLPFRLGAFQIAAQAHAPLVPIALRGTRKAMPDGNWLPRRGPISVYIGEPIVASGKEFADAVKLRDAARAQILSQVDEPNITEPVETVLTAGKVAPQ